jgi:cytidyltransferase-like protein
MLHSGHVAFLQEAAELGDLYVGLGSDKTIFALKNRRTINSDAERLYMVKALRCVKDAWINSGSGIMDFVEEVKLLKPDIFFVNTDGFTPAKEEFCREHGIKLVVSKRLPHEGLPARSTTAIRKECHFPYRIEICGGWMDQVFINKILPGSVITLQIEPRCEFNDRSGMATSSRNKAIEIWQGQIPLGDRKELARMLFCMENPPGSEHISGAQDQLGLLLPGLNKLNFNNGYWPVSIESDVSDETLKYVRDHLFLLPLQPRISGFDVFAGKNINEKSIRKLAGSADLCWQAIRDRDTAAWGKAASQCFDAQLEMFPAMATAEILAAREKYRNQVCGSKMTGSGGGGYMILISEKPVPNALQIIPGTL